MDTTQRDKANAATRRWAKRNPAKVRSKVKRTVRRQNRIILRFKRRKGCIECGTHDIRVLEYDHVPERGVKEFKLTDGKYRSWTRVREELAKCDVVCANHHNIRTWERREHDEYIPGIEEEYRVRGRSKRGV